MAPPSVFGMYLLSCISRTHDPVIVLISVLFCVAGAWGTVSSLVRLREATKTFWALWLTVAGLVAGATTWCTHFIAMLAYQPGVELNFDPVPTALSFLVAVFGSVASMWIAMSDRRVVNSVLGGLLLGGTVSTMHYVGMSAVTANGLMHWDLDYVIASVIVSMAFGILTMLLIDPDRGRGILVAATISFAICIVGLHYVGMGGLDIQSLLEVPQTALHRGLATFIASVGLLIGVVVLIVDRVEKRVRRDSAEKSRRDRLHDSLTGLPNRVHLHEHLTTCIGLARKDGRKVAVFLIDLVRFKDVNELRGYSVGDTVLKTIGGRLQAVIEDGEFVARSGSDEFAAIKVLDGPYESAADFVERLHDEISKSIEHGDDVLGIKANIGLAVFPDDGCSAETIIGNANAAMAKAKTTRLGFVTYAPTEIDKEGAERRLIVEEMRQAIQNGDMTVMYEPQIELAGGRISGYGARVGWNHRIKGPLHSSQFLPIAEETGMILSIKELVMRQACIDAASWPNAIGVSVRISEKQLEHVDIVSLVSRILEESSLTPSRLEIEVHETLMIAAHPRHRDALLGVQKLGVRIALTRFGKGNAALRVLGDFPFNRVGIDAGIVAGIETSVASRMVITAVIAGAKHYSIPVIADGVSTKEQRDFLVREGCNEAEGIFILPPITPGPANSIIGKAA